jgi:hypothetical protein
MDIMAVFGESGPCDRSAQNDMIDRKQLNGFCRVVWFVRLTRMKLDFD